VRSTIICHYERAPADLAEATEAIYLGLMGI